MGTFIKETEIISKYKLYKYIHFVAFTFILTTLIFVPGARGDTNIVDGIISSNTTWTKTDSPYIISGQLFVELDAFLEIDEGVIIRFNEGASIFLDGGLIIEGTSSENVLFTSNQAVPEKGDWLGVQGRDTSYLTIQWAVLEYSSNGIHGSYTHLEIDDSKFINNNEAVAPTTGGNLTRCLIEFNDCGVNGKSKSYEYKPIIIKQNTFEQNNVGIFGHVNITDSTFKYNNWALNNWRGSLYDSLIQYNINGVGTFGWMDNRVGEIINCTIKDNEGTAIYVGESESLGPYIRNTVIINNGGSALSTFDTSAGGYACASISDSIIRNNGGGVGTCIMSNTIVTNNGGGVTLGGSMLNCTIIQNTGIGVTVFSGNILIDSSHIIDNTQGLQLVPKYGESVILTLSKSEIRNNTYGGIIGPADIYDWGASVHVYDSIIENNGKFGVKMNTTSHSTHDTDPPPPIEVGLLVNVFNSRIENHTYGVIGRIGTITNSTIKDNDEIGIILFDLNNKITWNNIEDNSLYNIKSLIPFGDTIDATNNWWGTTDELTISNKIYDYYDDHDLSRVTYQPFLSGPLFRINCGSRQDDGETEDLGELILDGISIKLSSYVYKVGGSYDIEYHPSEGCVFDHWEYTDGVTVDNAYSQSSTITLSEEGTILAVYRRYFEDSFESGSFSSWSGTSASTGETVAVVPTLAHHGWYSAQSTSNGGGGIENAIYTRSFTASTKVYARGYFRVTQNGIADDNDRFYFIVLKSTTGNNIAYAGWRKTAGALHWCLVIRDGTGYVTTYSTQTPEFNQWYCMEVRWSKGSPGLGELYVDGVKVCTASGDTAGYGDAGSANYGLTEIYNCGPTTAYADCAVISGSYIGLEPPCSINLDSTQDTGGTSNLGSLTFDGALDSLPRTISTPAGGSYSAQYTPGSGYTFDHWEATGYLSLSSSTSNPTTVTVTGDGTLEAIYKVYSAPEIIVDDVAAVFVGTWPTSTTGAGTGLFYGPSYRYNYAGTGLDTATWPFSVPQAGQWEVYALWRSGTNRASNAKYVVNHGSGSTTVTVNQQLSGGQWVSLGLYVFDAGGYSVVLSDNANGVVIADAVRLVYSGSPPPPTYHDLTLTVSGSGSTTPSTGIHSYEEDTAVSVTATPASGWVLNHWTLDTSNAGSSNPIQVTMNSAHTLEAAFTETPPPPSEVIVDDVDASFVGSWSSSSSTSGYYGVGYRYRWAGSGANTATWTINVPETGQYEVFTMYTSGTNRASDAPYTINHSGGSTTVDVNQRVNGGMWVSLGLYSFNLGTATIRLSDNADGVVIADAVKLVLAGSLPQRELTIAATAGGSTDPIPGAYSYSQGSSVQIEAVPESGYTFGHWLLDGDDFGSDNPLTLVIDDDYGLTAVFTEAPSEIIVDDVDAVFVGSWSSSSSTSGYYGVGYRYRWAGTGSNTATWGFTVPSGSYEVYARWTSGTNRATNAPYIINHGGGSATVQVNQQVNGGSWQSLGVYVFNAGSASIVLSDNANGVVIADAVRLVASGVPPPPPEEVIVDDVDAGFTGTWSSSSSTSGYYGVGYRYRWAGIGSNTATWTLNVPQSGSWEVYAMWTSGTNRATNAPYVINHDGGSSTVRVSQRVGGGSWQSLGVYSFDEGTASVRLSDDADGVVIADAVRLIYIG